MSTMFEEIIQGHHDPDLDKLQEAIKLRRDTLARARLFGVTKGTKVRIVGDLRPAYLIGLTGTVDRQGPKNIVVHFDEPDKAGRYAHGIRLPAEFLERLAEQGVVTPTDERRHGRGHTRMSKVWRVVALPPAVAVAPELEPEPEVVA